MESASSGKSPFLKKVGPNLYRTDSGIYYLLVKRGGKQFRRSLKTTNPALAKRRLRELQEQAGHGQLDEHCHELLKMAMTELNRSARAHDRILKVARTTADLKASTDIDVHHLNEVIQYRTLDRSLWA